MSARLLLIDDEARLLDFLGLLFRDEGYDVTSAASMSSISSPMSV